MYTPLYIKTNNTLLSSMIKIDDLIEFSKKNNIKSLSITDNNMYGVMEFYNKCIKNNIKPIVGLEIIIDELPIILYCMNYNGYKNLIKINTLISENKLEIKELIKYSKDLICIVPVKSKKLYNDLKKEFMYIFIGYENECEKEKLKGDNLVYLNETLYIEKNDNEYIKYLYSIKDGVTVDSIDTVFDNHIRLENEITDLENNYKIYELCNLEIKNNNNLLPTYGVSNSHEYLKKLCLDGLKRIFGKSVKKIYIDRLKYELKVINEMGFSDYFLVVWDYIKYAKENDILVGPGRGSAAGSLVSYVLNITTIDPIKYDLLFERFLNPDRISMPDIDIDFEDEKREKVIDYCINKYGRKKVAYIITFGTLGAKQVIRDVGRSMNIDIKDIDVLSKMLDSRLSLIDNYNKNSKIKNYLSLDSRYKKLYKIGLKLEGLKRHTSLHAAGVIMSNTELDNVIPIESHNNFYTTSYSMEYLEEQGLLKMDFLGLRNLTLIKNILNDLKNDNINLSFDEIPIDDATINIFTTVNTIGIFQFESSGMMNFLRKFKPNTFDDVVASIALFRPGPMAMIDTYIARKHGLEKIDYIDPSLEHILKPTYGIIIYQEQIMEIVRTMASYTYAEADILRKAMSKKIEKIILENKDKFINGSIKNGYSIELSERVYNSILKFASYGFNKAHSVSYATISVKMAYLKAHHTSYFIKNLLNMVIGSDDKTKEYIYEAKLNNIEILKPDINLSNNTYKVEVDGIRYPLNSIKNVGENASNIILTERKKERFKNIFDFVKRTYGKAVTRKTIESLIDAGCFESFGLNKKTIHNNLDEIINYGELLKDLDEDLALKPVITEESEYTKEELMKKELEVFGFYLSNHPITEYKLKYKSIIPINLLDNYFDKSINTIAYVDRIKEIDTKNKDKMAFFSVSDEINTIDLVLFPKTYEQYENIKANDIILINAKVEKRFDKIQLVVNKIKKLN